MKEIVADTEKRGPLKAVMKKGFKCLISMSIGLHLIKIYERLSPNFRDDLIE